MLTFPYGGSFCGTHGTQMQASVGSSSIHFGLNNLSAHDNDSKSYRMCRHGNACLLGPKHY